MGRINMQKVVVGGVLAGLVFFVLDFAIGNLWLMQDMKNALQSLGKPMNESPSLAVYYGVLSLVFGIAMVWLYAAVRPRFGAGPRTAIIAALTVWFFTGLMHLIGEAPMGLMPLSLGIKMNVAWLVETPIAALVGCRFYKEEGSPAAP